jgi:cytochrome c556
MKKKLLAVVLGASLGAGYSMYVAAQAKPDVLVKQRQAAMTLQGKYLAPIGAMLKGAVPYNADVVARNATYLEALAQMPWDGFTPETQSEKTKAKPELFKDGPKVQQMIATFQADAAKLGAAARAKDEAGVRAAFGAVAKGCGGCHDAYREK